MKKFLLLALVIIAMSLLWTSGIIELITDMDRLRNLVDDAGVWGPVLFLLLMLILFPIFAAGPLVWLSAAIWPISLAITYSSIGSVLCGWFFFALTRHFGQESIKKKIPEKVSKYEKKLEENPWKTIVFLRAILWINPAVDALIGVSQISTRTYLLASAAALIPLTTIHILVVTYGIDFLINLPIWVYVLAAFIVLALVANQARNKKRFKSNHS